MGDGTEKNPYTREDVLRLIKEHGGKAEGLDLIEKWFEKNIDLSKLDLWGIILKGDNLASAHLEGAILREAHLEGAYLGDAHLEGANLGAAHLEEAYLMEARLQGAYLGDAHLEGANLGAAHLEEAYLMEAQFSPETRLEAANWGNYILGEEKEGPFVWAEAIYRRLKIWYTEHGMYDIAGKFFYREMEARRKAQSWRKPHLKLWNWVMRLLCGYGEKPLRVVVSGISVLFVLALIYFFSRGVAPYNFTIEAFSSSLYYSAVSFIALGYGPWFSANSVRSWVQGVGVAEAFSGVFMMALFLVTFTRKMIR